MKLINCWHPTVALLFIVYGTALSDEGRRYETIFKKTMEDGSLIECRREQMSVTDAAQELGVASLKADSYVAYRYELVSRKKGDTSILDSFPTLQLKVNEHDPSPISQLPSVEDAVFENGDLFYILRSGGNLSACTARSGTTTKPAAPLKTSLLTESDVDGPIISKAIIEGTVNERNLRIVLTDTTEKIPKIFTFDYKAKDGEVNWIKRDKRE